MFFSFASKDLRKHLIAKRRIPLPYRIPPLWTFHQRNVDYINNNKHEILLLQDIPYHLPRFPTSLAKPTDFLDFLYSALQQLVTSPYWNPIPDTINHANISFKSPSDLLTAPATDIYICKPSFPSYYSKTKLVCPPIDKSICPSALYTYLIKLHALYVQMRNALHHYENLFTIIRLVQTNFYLLTNNYLYSPHLTPPTHPIDWRGLYGNLCFGHKNLDTIFQCLRNHFQSYYNQYQKTTSTLSASSFLPTPSQNPAMARKRRHSSTSSEASSDKQDIDSVNVHAFNNICKQLKSLKKNINRAKQQKRS